MNRRKLLFGSFAAVVTAGLTAGVARPANAFNDPFFWLDEPDDYDPDYEEYLERKRRARARQRAAKASKSGSKASTRRVAYDGRKVVNYVSSERPGTIIIKTRERALYQILGSGRAMRYLVAVGKEGFSWSGTAQIGLKRVDPTWTPPAEMIKRKPEFQEWADGMPGGIPENPLGARAMYLYKGNRDTLFRIHGTNNPSSIGTAASSGCIRMLNHDVIQLYSKTPVGTKVIVS
jgi:lipoprotein-anchoring transpeptidase ErfK/SrfK